MKSSDKTASGSNGFMVLKMDATKTTLRKVFPKRGAKLTYEYDFGDSWDHVITRLADPKEPEISRNAPCPRGSGKKYKLCCGRGMA